MHTLHISYWNVVNLSFANSIYCTHFMPPCGWSFILEVNSSSTEFAGQAGQNWTFMSWYWAKSHLSNMDSGLIVLQHAVPSAKRSGISQRETASISGSSDSATWMFHSTMWMVFHLGSQFLLDGICRPSWSKTELSWVDTGQNHIFQTWIQVW